MNPLIPPIRPGEQGNNISNLHVILQSLIDRKIIEIPQDEWDKILPDLNAERQTQFYGDRTANIVMQFRLQNNLGDGLDVDEPTARAINSLLPATDKKMKVTGIVTGPDIKSLPGMIIKAYRLHLVSPELLGETHPGSEGLYEIPYTDINSGQPEREMINLQVFAYDENGLEVAQSRIYYNVPDTVAIDLAIPDKKDKLSEYERMTGELEPLLKGLSLEGLPEKGMDLLAGNTSIPREHIDLLRLAYSTASKYPAVGAIGARAANDRDLLIPVPVWYGWFRQSLPSEPALLLARPVEELIESLQAAVRSRIIPEQNADAIKKIRDAISRIVVENLLTTAEGSAASLGDVLNTIPEKLPYDKQFIVASVLRSNGTAGIPLGEKLKSAGLDEKQVSAVETTLAFRSFSENFLPLVKVLQEDPEINSLKQLALKFNKEDFARKVTDSKAFPENEKPEDFAGRLYNNLFREEPTAILRNMLSNDRTTPVEDAPTRTGVATFLSNAPASFNIKTTSVYEAFKREKAFEGIEPEAQEKVKDELKALQRVTAISHYPEAVPVLMKARVTSAQMVSTMPEEQFVQTFSRSFGQNGEVIARQIHVNAVNAQIRNEHALISFREMTRGTGIAMVDKAMKDTVANDNELQDILEQNHLSWDLLFGDGDLCECGECTSVYSAAAYYVDLLQYLRNNNLDPNANGPLGIRTNPKDISNTPLEKLFGRRPDLKCLQLTCKNTNTILPYVDLVNEIMESYVVAHKTSPFNVAEDETSGELLAQPHHTNDKAYEVLHDAVYPFSLPYHQPVDTTRLFLNFLGTSRYELMKTFRSVRDASNILEPFGSNKAPKIPLSPTAAGLDAFYDRFLSDAVDAEYLGLTQEEYVILTREAFVTKDYWDQQTITNGNVVVHTPNEYAAKIGAKAVQEYYGYSQQSSMLDTDETRQDGLTFVKHRFLKRTGLQYLELVELLKTQCLNPNVPQQQALAIMDRIRFSYRFLQSLVNPNGQTPKEKYAMVMAAIALITNPKFEAIINGMLGLEDPCGSETTDTALPPADISDWVLGYFEKIGKIIVLDNGTKCINGKLSYNNDGHLFYTGFIISNCKITEESTGKVIGAVDRTTGLVTLEGQTNAEWSRMVLTGDKGETGTFVNIGGKAYMINTKPETCDLETVRLVHLDGSPLIVEEYDHMHRFIRLWRKLGWTINETDNAIISLSTTGRFDISSPLLHQLAAVKKLYEQTGLELVKLLTFWGNINTAGEKSLYKRLFLTHNLVSMDSVFHDKNGRYLADPNINITDHGPVLMAALNLKADDIDAIRKYEAIDLLTIENVSKLYRYRLLSRILGLQVTGLVSVLPLFANPFESAVNTLLFLKQWKRMEDAGFTYLQLNYLIRGIDDPAKPIAPAKKTLLQLARTLYDGLNVIAQTNEDLKPDPGTSDAAEQERQKQALATSELVKQKAALLYDQVTVEKILGILEGTAVYSADSPAGVKDLLRPIPLVPPASVQDYEFLQPDNYPLLAKKVSYDSANGSLQIHGVLTTAELQGSSLFFDDDIKDIPGLVRKLTSTNRDPVSQYLWNQFATHSQDVLNNAPPHPSEQRDVIILELNKLITGGASIAANFNSVTLSVVTKALMAANPAATDELIRLNRLLLEDAYPDEIARNRRTGLTTVLKNVNSGSALDTAFDSIKSQQERSVNETFSSIFSNAEVSLLGGPDANDPAASNGNINTAPVKREKFLEVFLPYLRKELSHQLIVNTLSAQSGLGADTTDLLISNILKTGTPAAPIYTLLENINRSPGTVLPGWDGYLMPPAQAKYTIIIKNSNTKPALDVDDHTIDFVEQFPHEWWSVGQNLQSGKLYKLHITGIKMGDVYWKTATSSIAQIPSVSLLPGYVEDAVTEAFTLLYKAALLVSGFKLSTDEIQYLAAHPADFDGLDLNGFKFVHFLRLESYTRLRNSLPKAKMDILEFFSWMQGPEALAIKPLTADKRAEKLAEKTEELTGWKKERIQPLIRDIHFNLLQPELFRNEINLLELQKALKVADKIHINIDLLFDWAKPDSDFEWSRTIAESIRQAVRAQYQQEDWEQVVKPLNDKLRENQKNALIAYLLVQPALIKWGVTDADGLFEFFLIDVQMDACMETSRIKQAISSVQLFIQRCFLALEKTHADIPPNQVSEHLDIAPNLLDRKRWEWMQRYRIWEANRKVFLYPENWIESNLRDDKSIFFKELESELLQKDINRQNVEDALKSYLYKLDEVANMEVVGFYIEKEMYIENGQSVEKEKKLHVFSRTRNAPYAFYYRYLDIGANNWYPWEKMQVDIPSYDVEDVREFTGKSVDTENLWDGPTHYSIETTTYTINKNYKKIIGNGCYLSPTIWNGRLLIFFPQFVRKTKASEEAADSTSIMDISGDSTSSSKPLEYWEIKLAWSEYRNGKWTQKQMSKDSIADIPDTTGSARFWKGYNTVSKAKAKIDDAWRQKLSTNKIAWIKRNRWTASAQNDKQRDWDRYVKAWDQEVDASDKFNSMMDSNDYESQISIYNYAYGGFKNIPQPPPAADIARYLFIPMISNAGNLLGIRVDYSRDVNGTNQHEQKGMFEFNGATVTASPAGNYTYTRQFTRVDTFHHFASYIASFQKNDEYVGHEFNDGTVTKYIKDPLNYAYEFNFYHVDAPKLLGIINTQQAESLFKFPIDGIGRNTDKADVFGGYDHDNNAQTPDSYHELKRPYSIYNWELFFHTPMMLAEALSKSQQFEDAMKWYHYVFNPMADGQDTNRFWQFLPFKDTNAKHILDDILNKLKPNKSDDQINEWRNNPFKPHLVARSRPVAYMKWVVMKYVDNLVAWGDYLFRQDTIESINQATQLYVLAGHILGPRPQTIPKRGTIRPQTYFSLLDKWDANSNAMTELEIVLPFSSQSPLPIGIANGVTGLANVFGFASTTYFCIPNNPNLTGYWDTISDRLFKIRHCENIEGIFRKLPLFEPPIDPGLLVKAAAQGISISSVINDLNTPMPNYRFYYLLQKALELCAELKSMGAAMLSAIEKKDNETISLIRSRHESGMLNLMMGIKKQQLEEAQKGLESLQQNRKSPEHRMKYYLQLIGEDAGKVPVGDGDFSELANAIETPVGESGLKLIRYEKEDMDKAHAAADWQIGIGSMEALGSIFHAIPQFMMDVKPMGVGAGAGFGGSNLGNLTQGIAKVMQTYSSHLSFESTSAGKKGSFLRSLQERVMQANAAGYEIKQIDKQILSQQIRIGIANLEITNQQKQIDNAQEIEDFLKSKYSNEELYSWMKGSLSTLYHQVYNMAFELAKKAEKVFRFERGLTNSNFIQAGYWDAGYNGLLSGEQLYTSLKQLEAAYQENRGYDYEITRHVSLNQLNPMAILQLRYTGACEFTLPETLFDMDYPGHYKRRIKSVSVSVPCIAGPYTSLNGTLRLLENKFRNSALAKDANDYAEKTGETDDRFQGFIIPINAIAASSGQNDSGMFELNFKDERYLPFEGAGAISRWRFELPAFRQFDYTTISDLIVHIRYTSVEGGQRLKNSAAGNVVSYMKSVEELGRNEGLFVVINIKHDMPDAWHLLKMKTSVDLQITDSRLPYFTQLFTGKHLVAATLVARLSDPAQPAYTVSVPDAATTLVLDKDMDLGLYTGVVNGLSFNTPFRLAIDPTNPALLEELVLLVKYSL